MGADIWVFFQPLLTTKKKNKCSADSEETNNYSQTFKNKISPKICKLQIVSRKSKFSYASLTYAFRQSYMTKCPYLLKIFSPKALKIA